MEEGEECDAGSAGRADKDPCCDSKCKFKPGVACRYGCLHLNISQFIYPLIIIPSLSNHSFDTYNTLSVAFYEFWMKKMGGGEFIFLI